MRIRPLISVVAFALCAVFGFTIDCSPAAAQQAGTTDLRMVLVVMRHGVRSPNHPEELNQYSAQPWPKWEVPNGYLTPHGAALIRQFGSHYRALYDTSIFSQSGCPTPGSVFVWADTDQRTRATGDALIDGLAPRCGLTVQHAPGKDDRLFDPLPDVGKVDVATSKASVVGALGGDPNALVDAYRATFASLDRILGCTRSTRCRPISTVPTTIASTGDGGLAEFDGGLDLAAGAAENLLLEYTDGQKVVGWGRLDAARLLAVLKLHALKQTFQHENPYAAAAHSSNILSHIVQTLRQGATGEKVGGTRVPASAKFVAIVGHDTQLSELAGLLRLSWLMRGYQLNDTPPGAALVFEVHGPAASSAAHSYVRTYFTAASLEQMRSGQGSNPARVPVFVPGCPSLDCPLATFEHVALSAIDPAFVAPW